MKYRHVLALLALAACSGASPAAVDVLSDSGGLIPPSSSSGDAGGPVPADGGAFSGEAGIDAAPDAPIATSCGEDDAGEALQQVEIEGLCSPSECFVPGAYHYISPNAAYEPGNDRPPIPGCLRLPTPPGGATEFCCPAACIRLYGGDFDCASRTLLGAGALAYSCPGDLSPGPDCLDYGPDGYATTYCCPAP